MDTLEGMKQLVGIGCAVMTLLLVPAVAAADEDEPQAKVTQSTTATTDTVHLRSGGLVLGRVTEIVAGDHVSLVVSGGETRSIPWSDVERLVIATTSFPPRPPAAVPDKEVVAAPMVGPRARVHIEGSGAAYLYRRAAGTTEFVTACESPCDLEMPLGDTYVSMQSDLTQKGDKRAKASAEPAKDASRRGPSWRSVAASEQSGAPRATFPLLFERHF